MLAIAFVRKRSYLSPFIFTCKRSVQSFLTSLILNIMCLCMNNNLWKPKNWKAFNISCSLHYCILKMTLLYDRLIHDFSFCRLIDKTKHFANFEDGDMMTFISLLGDDEEKKTRVYYSDFMDDDKSISTQDLVDLLFSKRLLRIMVSHDSFLPESTRQSHTQTTTIILSMWAMMKTSSWHFGKLQSLVLWIPSFIFFPLQQADLRKLAHIKHMQRSNTTSKMLFGNHISTRSSSPKSIIHVRIEHFTLMSRQNCRKKKGKEWAPVIPLTTVDFFLLSFGATEWHYVNTLRGRWRRVGSRATTF